MTVDDNVWELSKHDIERYGIVEMDEDWFVTVLDKLNDVQNEVHLLMQDDCEAVLNPVVDLLNKAEDAILEIEKNGKI